jgi:CBS domain-containing protein
MVAQMMATNHIHCVVVMGPGFRPSEPDRPWGVVSDLHLIAAGADAEERDAASACANEVVTVTFDETLERAAKLMTEHDTAHLVVVDSATPNPVGVISSLDIAGVIAWGRP